MILVSLIIPVFAQDTQVVNLSGTWQVYRLNHISRYTLSEHQNPQTSAAPPGSGTITLNEDGIVVADISGLNAQTLWGGSIRPAHVRPHISVIS